MSERARRRAAGAHSVPRPHGAVDRWACDRSRARRGRLPPRRPASLLATGLPSMDRLHPTAHWAATRSGPFHLGGRSPTRHERAPPCGPPAAVAVRDRPVTPVPADLMQPTTGPSTRRLNKGHPPGNRRPLAPDRRATGRDVIRSDQPVPARPGLGGPVACSRAAVVPGVGVPRPPRGDHRVMTGTTGQGRPRWSAPR